MTATDRPADRPWSTPPIATPAPAIPQAVDVTPGRAYLPRPISRSRRGLRQTLFATLLLALVGCLNCIYGVAAIVNSHIFVAKAHYVFGGLFTWGLVALVFGALQLLAGVGVLAGSPLARWTGVALLWLDVIAQMLSLGAYPLWSLTIVAVNVIGIYVLCSGRPPGPDFDDDDDDEDAATVVRRAPA
jgi:hypothetical protein